MECSASDIFFEIENCEQSLSCSKIRGKNANEERRAARPLAVNSAVFRRLRALLAACDFTANQPCFWFAFFSRHAQPISKNNIIERT